MIPLCHVHDLPVLCPAGPSPCLPWVLPPPPVCPPCLPRCSSLADWGSSGFSFTTLSPHHAGSQNSRLLLLRLFKAEEFPSLLCGTRVAARLLRAPESPLVI